MFKPRNNCVMVELVLQKEESGLIIPDSAKKNGNVHDLIVKRVGDGVTHYEVGDKVMTPLPKNSQLAQFDDGDGVSTFVFWDEDDVYGKYVEGDK